MTQKISTAFRTTVFKTLLIISSSALFNFTAHAEDDYGSSKTKKPNMFTSEYKPSIGLLAGVKR